MNNQPTTFKSGALSRFFRVTFIAGLLPSLVVLFSIQPSHAGSATWDLNPSSGDWNTAVNWTPATVPNDPSDTATFASSNIAGVSLSTFTEVNGILFNAGASAFTITASPQALLIISGVGITNNSGITQNFVTAVDGAGNFASTYFTNSATAGINTAFTNDGAISGAFPARGGVTEFHDSSTAGSNAFTNNGGGVSGGIGGDTVLRGNSAAANGTFTNNGGAVSGAFGGTTEFHDSSTAGSSAFTNNGGTVSGSSNGGYMYFADTSTAGSATLIANGGTGGGAGSNINFFNSSTGGTARVEVFGNGNLDISSHNTPGVTIGSLEGTGNVSLAANNLTVGSNNLSKTFSGVIQDGFFGSGGSLTKTGRGKLTLSNASTFTGGTTISKGTLLVANRTGSATGIGAVAVNAGTLGGTGKISGAVTIGTATTAAILAPGNGTRAGKLTLLKTLTFNGLATYKVDLNSTLISADQVAAKGVTINSGATVTIDDLGTAVLTSGTVFTIISNTATTAIAGTFGNLADGSTLTVGSNTYLVSYEGGTGNDLTLTVQ